MAEKLTKAELAMLGLATRSQTGNPWLLVGCRQRAGKRAMFGRLKARGFFNAANCITEKGRAALSDHQGDA